MANKLSEQDLGAISAYAIAKEHGYTGTEQEWIDELMATTQNAQDARVAAEFVEERTFGVVIEDHGIQFDEREVVTDSLAQRAEEAAETAMTLANTAQTYAQRAETAASTVSSAISGTAQSSIIADAFSTGRTYPVGAYVTYNNKLYTCIDAVNVQGAWNSSNWQETKVTDFMNIPLDDELETEGVAADAKAVGDAIEEIRTSTTQAIAEANAWQAQGTNGQIMSKKEGVATWIDAPVPDITLSLVGESADAKAVGDAFTETNEWKTQGTTNQILSKSANGVVWIDNPPVDKTLTIEDQPADAKAVGDKIDEIDAWKSEGTVNQILSMGENGVTWIDNPPVDATLSIRDQPADAEAVGVALAQANAWKSEGTENQILSKNTNGIKWIDNPPVDATLTVENQPADAKAVGEILRSHDSRISNAASDATSALSKTGVLNVTVATQDEAINEMQSTVSDMSSILESLVNGAEVIDGRLVFQHDGEELFSVPWGGGGSGGTVDSVQMTSQLTTGWLSKNTIKTNIPVTFTWSSVENEIETGPGRASLECNGFYSESTVQQGECEMTISKEWLLTGKNSVKLYIYDSQNHSRKHTLTVNVSDVRIESTLDNSTPFYNSVTVGYTPYGKFSKTIHFVLDGEEIDTMETTLSDTALEYIIPQQDAGIHTFEMYITATIGNDDVTSDKLYYELIWLDEFSDRPFITLSTEGGEVNQFDTVNIPFRVYTRNKLYTDVDVYVNGVLFTSLKDLDTSLHTFSYMFEDATDPENESDVITISFTALGMSQPRSVSYRVKPSEIVVNAETTGLTLYLDSKNRSNDEQNWNTWKYNDIEAVFTGFNRKFDGWQTDDDGYNVLRVENNARVYIPFEFFDRDFTTNGATFEIEFATRRVIDYNTNVVTCLDGTTGFRFTPTLVQFNTGTQIWARYSDNEHVRVSYVFDRSNYNENEQLIKIYINGVWSKTVWYSSSEDTTQDNRTGISIGSNDAAIDIYCIRAYNRMLTDRQIVNNYLADMRNKSEMTVLYRKNDIYNSDNQITPETIRDKIPVIILSCAELPQSKEDEKEAKVEFYNDAEPQFSFETVINPTIAGQGTSSSAYFRKNISIKYPANSIKMNNSSTPVSEYALTANSIPFNSFVLKKDVASSEGANNVQGCMIYNDFCPYKTKEMIEVDSRFRWGIEGYPAVLFWRNTTDNTIEFVGRDLPTLNLS